MAASAEAEGNGCHGTPLYELEQVLVQVQVQRLLQPWNHGYNHVEWLTAAGHCATVAAGFGRFKRMKSRSHYCVTVAVWLSISFCKLQQWDRGLGAGCCWLLAWTDGGGR